MSDTPVFSASRHAELVRRAVERARAEERTKIASALEVQANTVGGVIGAALREVATQITSGVAVATPAIVGTAERRDRGEQQRLAMEQPPLEDPAYNLAIPFEALNEEQRQRRLQRYHVQLAEANQRFAEQQRADEQRIAADAERRRRGEVVDDVIDDDVLPPVVHGTDDDDLKRAVQKSHVRPAAPITLPPIG